MNYSINVPSNEEYSEKLAEKLPELPTKRTMVNELPGLVDKQVLLKGWVSQYRELKKFSFIILRDRTGYTNVFVPKDIVVNVLPETVIEIIGKVKSEPQSKYNGIEVVAEKINIISNTEVIPFPISREEDLPPFNTLNLHRPLTLRKEKERCIFHIQSEMLYAFREFMRGEGFTEINSTKISAAGLEGGAEMFEVQYFENKMYLTQSPQFYKQMMVGVYERVFEVGKVYRAEGSNTNKHLAEYVGLDFEMGFIESVEDVMSMEENMLKHVFNHIQKHCSEELEYLKTDIKFNPIPRITYNEVVDVLKKVYNYTLPAIGLTTEAERLISEHIFNTTESEFVFITKYPLSERPFYAMPSIEGNNNSETFELLYKGMEITSGGQRIHNYKQLVESISSKGIDPNSFESYLMPFKYGMPAHGGCGIGLERVMMQLLNLGSVQECSLIPRTREKFIH
jgi:nondiscriminating aspartyl-tRNA synthetase